VFHTPSSKFSACRIRGIGVDDETGGIAGNPSAGVARSERVPAGLGGGCPCDCQCGSGGTRERPPSFRSWASRCQRYTRVGSPVAPPAKVTVSPEATDREPDGWSWRDGHVDDQFGELDPGTGAGLAHDHSVGAGVLRSNRADAELSGGAATNPIGILNGSAVLRHWYERLV